MQKSLLVMILILMIASQHKFQYTVATTVGSVLANNGNGADSLNGIAVTSAIPMLHQ
jgi:hypothetical protein